MLRLKRVHAAVSTVALAILVSGSPVSAQATSSGGYIDDVPNNYQFWAGVRVHF